MELKKTRSDAEILLTKQISIIEALVKQVETAGEFYSAYDVFKREHSNWEKFTLTVICAIFEGKEAAEEFEAAEHQTSRTVVSDEYESWLQTHESVKYQIAAIKSLVERLHLFSEPGEALQKTKTGSHRYVVQQRIDALKKLRDFDPIKLIRLCEELNDCFEAESYISSILLLRSILDHVPPIFNAPNFAAVANNYPGTRSFKESMARLDSSSRKIADAHLHTQIRAKESIPNATQVDFSNDLDLLLAEIERTRC